MGPTRSIGRPPQKEKGEMENVGWLVKARARYGMHQISMAQVWLLCILASKHDIIKPIALSLSSHFHTPKTHTHTLKFCTVSQELGGEKQEERRRGRGSR